MRKIIPFLFGSVVLLCVFVLVLYRAELSSGQTDVMNITESTEDESGAVVSVLPYAENAFGGDVVQFATHTSRSVDQVSTSTMPVSSTGHRSIRNTATAPISATGLVKVQPGFGGGSAPAEWSPLVQLPEYKEEQEKVEPKIEFEYCE